MPDADAPTGRPRPVAAAILGALLIGGYFAASGGEPGAMPGEYLLHAGLLLVAFWLPAIRIHSPRDVLRQWKALSAWVLAWTLTWDMATAGLLPEREPFQEWWLVYPAALLAFAALFILHGAATARWTRRPA